MHGAAAARTNRSAPQMDAPLDTPHPQKLSTELCIIETMMASTKTENVKRINLCKYWGVLAPVHEQNWTREQQRAHCKSHDGPHVARTTHAQNQDSFLKISFFTVCFFKNRKWFVSNEIRVIISYSRQTPAGTTNLWESSHKFCFSKEP